MDGGLRGKRGRDAFGVGGAGVVAGAVGCVKGVDGGGAYEGEGREGGFK